MRLPGIKSIAVAEAQNLPANIELTAAAGITPSLSGVTFQAVPFVGEPTGTVEDSNENNGAAPTVTLTFNVPFRAQYRRHAFAVTLVTGESYLIGCKESIPAVSTKDNAAGPGTANVCTVTVTLTSFCSWIPLGQVLPNASSADGGTAVNFQSWREITSGEIDSIINSLT